MKCNYITLSDLSASYKRSVHHGSVTTAASCTRHARRNHDTYIIPTTLRTASLLLAVCFLYKKQSIVKLMIYIRGLLQELLFAHSFIHSTGMCTMQQFPAVLRTFFHSSLLYTFSDTLLHQLFLHLPSLNLVIYFLVYLLILLIPNSYTILFWEFYFLQFPVLPKPTQSM
jgi:hypothetical protein